MSAVLAAGALTHGNVPLGEALAQILPVERLDEERARAASHGRAVPVEAAGEELLLVDLWFFDTVTPTPTPTAMRPRTASREPITFGLFGRSRSLRDDRN